MTDKGLRRKVLDRLDADPGINAASIGVAVSEGVVTLSGQVASYAEKYEVERVVREVRGVRAIALELVIHNPHAKQIADEQIAGRALAIIDWYARIPSSVLMVKVANGWITLTGEVEHQYQAMAAEAAVRKLSGVVGVSNLITVAPTKRSPVVKERVLEALKHHVAFETDAIRIQVDNDRVTLEGTVSALAERDAAERAAWSVPGVRMVEDHITVV